MAEELSAEVVAIHALRARRLAAKLAGTPLEEEKKPASKAKARNKPKKKK